MLWAFAGNIQASISQETSTEPKLKVDLGGTLRFNYNYSSWKPNQKKRGGDFGYDVFRINVDAMYKKLELHLDQRFYAASSGGTFLKYGWFQYNLNKKSHLKFGLIPTYFGTQPFNSNSWFFSLPYYLGFEDDYDMGLSYDYKNDKIELDIGFYKNAETLNFSDNDPISDSRYSYDFSGRNMEINQLNFRFNYKIEEKIKHNIGTSFQYGGIWNIDTQDIGTQAALGIHHDMSYKRWNLKSQLTIYENKPKNLEGESNDIIEMTAYGSPYNTAAKATIYSIALAYKIPIKKDILDEVKIYNDYAYMDKFVKSWEDTQMNVTGILLSAKSVYIHFDYALGLQHPWLGPQYSDALSTGDTSNSWESRFNINIGFYY